MSFVLEFSFLDLSGRWWLGWSDSFERLNACFFITTDDVNSLLLEPQRGFVQFADFLCLLCELLKIFDVGIEPVATEMRSKVCFFLKIGRGVDRKCS